MKDFIKYNNEKNNIHIIEFNNNVTDDIFFQYEKLFTTILKKNNNNIIIFDLFNIGKIDLKFLKKQKKLINDVEYLIDSNLKCSCILTDSKIVRNFLKILFKFKPPTQPLIVTNSVEKAKEFYDPFILTRT